MALNPLVRTFGLQQLQEREQARMPPVTNIARFETESALAGHVREAWGRNKLAKERTDMKLISCLRARRGLYSPGDIAARLDAGGVNIIWYDLTETKCRAASAWVREIILPASERPWGLDATPLPDLPLPFKQTIVAKSIKQAQELMMQISQDGGELMPSDEFRTTVKEIGEKLRSEAEEQYQKAAATRAKRMEKQIADRMAQGNWAQALDAFVEDFVTYPSAILKGPIYQRHKRLTWKDDWTPEVKAEPAQTWETVSPFDAYPAPGAPSPQHGDFIERIRFWRNELFDLKGMPGYRDDQIDGALMDYSNGHIEGWLWTEAERQRLTQESLYMWLSPPGLIDALNYYGSVPGWKLMSWGVSAGELEETRDYEANVLLIGRYIVYAALNPNPLGQRPYRNACYDAIPGAFWGRSITELAETSQKFCNVAGCAMADNIAMASGPMVWVHNDRLADGEQSLEIIPWKVWQLKDAGMGAGTNPGIGFFQASDNSANLQKTLEFWESKADDATGIPRYTYGNDQVQGGAAGTATGLSMLLNNAAKGLRRAISNIDLNVIAPTVGDAFVNEMLYNPDESIKGDCIIVPRGAAAILIKDMAQQRRMQFMGMTANEIDMAIIGNKGRATLLRETAAAMELPDDVVPTEDELEQKEQAQAQAQQEAMAAEQQAMQQQAVMEGQKEVAKVEAQNRGKQADQMNAMVGDVLRSQMAQSQAQADAAPQKPKAPPGKLSAQANALAAQR